MELTAADFAGDWLVERMIDDRLGGRPARFDGRARFLVVPGGLRYEEEGQLHIGGAPAMAATRAYLWDFGPDGVAVRFADGRPFHRFVPGRDGAGSDHPCGEDLYRVTYAWGDWPRWQATWEVRGPRKDYRMQSLYRRS